jgi:N-carbamoylputrescine amidase
MFSLACAQIAPKKGDLAANLDTIAEVALQSSNAGVDLVVFPEGSTTGYFLEGGVLEAALRDDELLDMISTRLEGKLTRPLDMVLGFYQKAGGNLYNSAAYLELGRDGGRIVHVYRKFFLPTYGVFDEERFVARGKELGVFDTRLGRVGILICEDLWHSILPTLSALAGAQLLIVPSASPGRGFSGNTVESLDRYHRLLTAVAEEHGIWCANCQLCGFEGGKGFVGGSSVVDPNGAAVAVSPVAEPHLLVAEVDLDLITIARSASPLLADLENAWADIQRIITRN